MEKGYAEIEQNTMLGLDSQRELRHQTTFLKAKMPNTSKPWKGATSLSILISAELC